MSLGSTTLSGGGGRKGSLYPSKQQPSNSLKSSGTTGGAPLIRRIAPPDRLIRIIENGSNNKGCSQQMPCFPPPPSCFFPPPPGFCPPFMCPPPFRPPCFMNNQPPNYIPNSNISTVRKPCSIDNAQENSKPPDQQPTSHFNNCNFYMSDPSQNINPGFFNNPLVPPYRPGPTSNYVPPCVVPETTLNTIPAPKKTPTLQQKQKCRALSRKKCAPSSESDCCSTATSDSYNKVNKDRNMKRRSTKKRYSCPPVARRSSPSVRIYTKRVVSTRCTEESCDDKDRSYNDTCRNTTIHIRPDPPIAPQPPPPPVIVPPAPPRQSCCKSTNHPKVNPCCQKCIERYIEKQVAALRSKKKCCCSSTAPKTDCCSSMIPQTNCCAPRNNCCPAPKPCQEEQQCATDVSIKIEPSYIHNTIIAFKDEECCTDLVTSRSQATITVQAGQSNISIMSETQHWPTPRIISVCPSKQVVLIEQQPSVCPSNFKSQVAVLVSNQPTVVCPSYQNSQISVVVQANTTPECERPCNCPLPQTSHIAVVMKSCQTCNTTCPSNQKSHISLLVDSNPICPMSAANSNISLVVESEKSAMTACTSAVKSHIAITVPSYATSACPTAVCQSMAVKTQSSMTTVTLLETNPVQTGCSKFFPLPTTEDCVDVSISTQDFTVSHKLCKDACTSNAVVVKSQICLRPVSLPPLPPPRCPSQHVVLQTQNTCQVPEIIQCIPTRRKHRIVKPSYSKIQGMVVRKTSDKCVRRQHITFVKQHVPHETIQNSEVDCTYQVVQPPFTAQQCTTVFADITAGQQQANVGNATECINRGIPHREQVNDIVVVKHASLDDTDGACNNQNHVIRNPGYRYHITTEKPNDVVIFTHVSQSNLPITCPNNARVPAAVYNVSMNQETKGQTFHLQDQSLGKSWHWKAEQETPNSKLNEQNVARHSIETRRATKRKLPGY